LQKWKYLKGHFQKQVSKCSASSSGANGDLQCKPTWPFFELLLFQKYQMIPKKMSVNLQACSSSQNIQKSGVPGNTGEENGGCGKRNETLNVYWKPTWK
jgi:hypothetical protein